MSNRNKSQSAGNYRVDSDPASDASDAPEDVPAVADAGAATRDSAITGRAKVDVFRVAPGCALFCHRGALPPGEVVTWRDFCRHSGEQQAGEGNLKQHLESGSVVRGKINPPVKQ